MNKLNVLGIMSGSSLDGLDLALISFIKDKKSPPQYEWIHTASIGYDAKWIANLQEASKQNIRTYQVLETAYTELVHSQIHNEFTQFPIDLISWHGHTIARKPQEKHTLALGNGSYLHALSRIPVVNQFRDASIHMGGQGAPLMHIVDAHFFNASSAVLNLGGIANISIPNQKLSYDLCGCNQILNFLARKEGYDMDRDGHISSNGKMHTSLFEELNEWSYLKGAAPKSLDNSEVQAFYFPVLEKYNISTADKMVSFMHHIGQTIYEAVGTASKEIIITGGGAYNLTLIKIINSYTQNNGKKMDSKWIDFKEAFLMSYLGYLKWQNENTILASYCGGKKDISSGVLYNFAI